MSSKFRGKYMQIIPLGMYNPLLNQNCIFHYVVIFMSELCGKISKKMTVDTG